MLYGIPLEPVGGFCPYNFNVFLTAPTDKMDFLKTILKASIQLTAQEVDYIEKC